MIIPAIKATIAFNLGLPGALIIRAKFGLKNVATPIKATITQTIIIIIFTVSMVSISV